MSDETKFVGKKEESRGTTYITEKGTHIKKTPSSLSVYSGDPQKPHDSVHFNQREDGSFSVTEKIDGEKSESSCYLTTACLKYLREQFDDACHELTVLRWFRDKFVKPEDVALYYKVAPKIVKGIDSLPKKKQENIYLSIYTDIVSVCVQFIEKGEYDLAYKRYKDSTLELQRLYAPNAI